MGTLAFMTKENEFIQFILVLFIQLLNLVLLLLGLLFGEEYKPWGCQSLSFRDPPLLIHLITCLLCAIWVYWPPRCFIFVELVTEMPYRYMLGIGLLLTTFLIDEHFPNECRLWWYPGFGTCCEPIQALLMGLVLIDMECNWKTFSPVMDSIRNHSPAFRTIWNIICVALTFIGIKFPFMSLLTFLLLLVCYRDLPTQMKPRVPAVCWV